MSTTDNVVVGSVVLGLARWNVYLTIETAHINRNGRGLTAWANDALLVGWTYPTHSVVFTLHSQADPGGSSPLPLPPPPPWE